MRNTGIWITGLLIILSTQLFAQKGAEPILGKWLTEDNSILEFFKSGSTIAVKQLNAGKEKDKKDNGKLVAKNLLSANKIEYNGTVIDPSNSKEYEAVFTMAPDGKSLKLKVKWGFISFKETWKKL
jgi:uncharacterized protein (DUF2147 family)